MANNKSPRPATGKSKAKASSKESLSGLDKTGLHVLRSPGGGWFVKVDGKASAVDRFSTKKEAVSFARSLKVGSFAKKKEKTSSRKADIVVHDGFAFNTKSFKRGKVSRPEVPDAPQSKHRTFGSAKGRIRMANDFDETPGDFADYLE